MDIFIGIIKCKGTIRNLAAQFFESGDDLFAIPRGNNFGSGQSIHMGNIDSNIVLSKTPIKIHATREGCDRLRRTLRKTSAPKSHDSYLLLLFNSRLGGCLLSCGRFYARAAQEYFYFFLESRPTLRCTGYCQHRVIPRDGPDKRCNSCVI